MIKTSFKTICDSNGLDFDELETGDTFLVSYECGCFIGMKIMDIDKSEPLILDISEEIGEYYRPHKTYKIEKLIDLKLEEL